MKPKILDELREVLALIEYLKDLLSSEKKILEVVKKETLDIAEKYGDERRTQIVADEVEEINLEDLIKEEDMVVLISNRGFIKRIPITAYRIQGRGGKGSQSANLKNEDFLEHLFIASTHEYIMFVTNAGKAYWIKVFEIPEGSRASRGVPIKTLLAVSADEEITAIVSLKEFSDETFLFMATSKGIVKKVNTRDFSNAKTRGIIAIKLDPGDKLASAMLTSGDCEVVLVSRRGNALRFHEDAIRQMGRASRGVMGIRLGKEDELAGALAVRDDEHMLILSDEGLGKRISYSNFSPHGRATRGQMAYKVADKTGEIVRVISVGEEDDIVCISSQGNTIKVEVKEIPILGKAAQGVRVVNIIKPDFIVGTARVVNEKE